MFVYTSMCLWFVIFYYEFVFSMGHDMLRIPTREEVYYNSEIFGCGTYQSLSNRKHTGRESAKTRPTIEINRSPGPGDWLWECPGFLLSPGLPSKSLRLACRIHRLGSRIWIGHNDS